MRMWFRLTLALLILETLGRSGLACSTPVLEVPCNSAKVRACCISPLPQESICSQTVNQGFNKPESTCPPKSGSSWTDRIGTVQATPHEDQVEQTNWKEYLSEYRRLGPLALDTRTDNFGKWRTNRFERSYSGGLNMPFGRHPFGPWSPGPRLIEEEE